MFAGEKKTTQLKLKCSIFTLYCNSFILFFLAFLTRTLFHVLTTVKKKSKKQGVNPLVKKQKEERCSKEAEETLEREEVSREHAQHAENKKGMRMYADSKLLLHYRRYFFHCW